ncbi:MAG: MBL fold metallo-hydrolase [Candidatus Zixiibacteriota bacterium]|nr:MAG: MBL fold metallo-hydrolase [candidate division Zixibacteria bacterium]
MRPNNELKLHFVNVNHGDCTIIEFPDFGSPAVHFGVVDFGAKLGADRALPRDYMQALIDVRRDTDPTLDYVIDFVCVSHPHDDHYGGLNRFLAAFADPQNRQNNKISRYWDCGFWTTASRYNQALATIRDNVNITFTRVSSGAEYEFGEARVTVLAPSIDLRNRYDTYGINRNNASVVLRIKFRNSYAIIAGDAQFASWGKTTEEFPRQRRIEFFSDALGFAAREDTSDQLKCNVLRVSHHGSKHGTSLEYLERVDPDHVVIPAGSQPWYTQNIPEWVGYFPHRLTDTIFDVLVDPNNRHVTGARGNIIFKYNGGWTPRQISYVTERADSANFTAALAAQWDQTA